MDVKQPETLILNIETSTNVCSVSLSGNAGKILSYRENLEDKSHSALLAVFIQEVMQESGKSFNDLSAVSVSKGPGSYTGLRIGVSTAKGICYAKSIPLIAVNTLDILTRGFLKNRSEILKNYKHKILLCPMIDARRMEVYTALYNTECMNVKKTTAEIIDENSFKDLLDKNFMFFFGNGAAKCSSIISHPQAKFIDGDFPSAKEMGEVSAAYFHKAQFENLAYFEPFYLKDFVATVPKKQV